MAADRPVVAVDIDDVLTPHFQDLASWYNEQYGTKLTLADNHPKSVKGWGTADEKTAIRRVQRFFETEEFRKAAPFEEAHAVLKVLNHRYDLVVVTARDTIIERLTRDWISKHFEDLFTDIHFSAQYNLDGLNKSKADILVAIGAKYLIDDAPHHIEAAVSRGITCILFGEYPWNETDKLPAGSIRCKDWAAVKEYFDGRQG